MATTYRRGYRRSYRPTIGRVDKPNKRPGPCRDCKEEIPAYGGQLYREQTEDGRGEWAVVHVPQDIPPANPWTSQVVTGGCPEATDRENTRRKTAGFIKGDVDSERVRVERRAARLAANAETERPVRSEAPRDRRGGYLDECGSCGAASCSCP